MNPVQEDILRALPHRPPFLFIDEILDLTDAGITARRTLRAEEPHFAGHYPGNPIMPGVLTCEAVFQAAAIYLVSRTEMSDTDAPAGGLTPVLARIKEARFKALARPGDELLVCASYSEALGQFHFLKGKVTCGGRTVLTISFALALIDEKAGS